MQAGRVQRRVALEQEHVEPDHLDVADPLEHVFPGELLLDIDGACPCLLAARLLVTPSVVALYAVARVMLGTVHAAA